MEECGRESVVGDPVGISLAWGDCQGTHHGPCCFRDEEIRHVHFSSTLFDIIDAMSNARPYYEHTFFDTLALSSGWKTRGVFAEYAQYWSGLMMMN
jgi:hypothetical protein